MKEFSSYILEKLKINKDTKLINKKELISDKLLPEIRNCLSNEYKISFFSYSIDLIDDKKCITNNYERTWYVDVSIGISDEKIASDIKDSLKEILDKLDIEDNIQMNKINNKKFNYKIFLHDPE